MLNSILFVIIASYCYAGIIVFFHSSLIDGVLPAISRDYPPNIVGYTFTWKISIVHHDFSYSIHLDYSMRLKCTFPVSCACVRVYACVCNKVIIYENKYNCILKFVTL